VCVYESICLSVWLCLYASLTCTSSNQPHLFDCRLFLDYFQFFGGQSKTKTARSAVFFLWTASKNRAKRGFFFLHSVTVNTIVHTESETCQKQWYYPLEYKKIYMYLYVSSYIRNHVVSNLDCLAFDLYCIFFREVCLTRSDFSWMTEHDFGTDLSSRGTVS